MTIQAEKETNAFFVIWRAWKMFSKVTTTKLIENMEKEKFLSLEHQRMRQAFFEIKFLDNLMTNSKCSAVMKKCSMS